MQNSATADEQIDDADAGESAHVAANAASSQADASTSMTPDEETPGGPAAGAGESGMAGEAVPSPS